MTQTIKLQINEWTGRNGQTRRYVNNWIEAVGFDVEYYKTGNIRSASINGQQISNAAAGRLCGVKVWIDSDDTIHIDHWANGTERYAITPEQIRERIAALLY